MGLLVTFNPLESHGIVGQDGYLGLRHSTCDSIGHPTLSHPVPWHSGTGWSLGMSVGHTVHTKVPLTLYPQKTCFHVTKTHAVNDKRRVLTSGRSGSFLTRSWWYRTGTLYQGLQTYGSVSSILKRQNSNLSAFPGFKVAYSRRRHFAYPT